MVRFLTAGESHGQTLVAIVEGIPAGLALNDDDINRHLARRQRGYGRSARMKLEVDRVEVLSGVLGGETIGAPIAMKVDNRDWRKEEPPFHRPRPGHADLVGAQKYGFTDLRRVLERSSARETAARVAAGAVCLRLLEEFGVRIFSHVIAIGDVSGVKAMPWEELAERAEASELRCGDEDVEARMRTAIDDAKKRGDTVGGIFEVVALGVPPGLGSYVQWDRRLDGRLAQAVMSIQAIKGVEVGPGFEIARTPGSAAHDEIFWTRERGFYRETNRAGGTEGGVSTGGPVLVRGAMKPLSTLMSPLRSVDVVSKEPIRAVVVRSDVCSVPAAGVVAEAMVALVLADAFQEKFGADTIAEMRAAYEAYRRRLLDG